MLKLEKNDEWRQFIESYVYYICEEKLLDLI